MGDEQRETAEDMAANLLEGIPIVPSRNRNIDSPGVIFLLEKASLEIARFGKVRGHVFPACRLLSSLGSIPCSLNLLNLEVHCPERFVSSNLIDCFGDRHRLRIQSFRSIIVWLYTCAAGLWNFEFRWSCQIVIKERQEACWLSAWHRSSG